MNTNGFHDASLGKNAETVVKRKMLFFERLMYIDGKTPVNCLITARICGLFSEENLRDALDKVQAKHPMLRANVIEDEGGPYFEFRVNSTKIPLRIIERNSGEDWQKVTFEEWKTPFDMSRDPLVRLVWIKSEGISELLLIGHHCVCDGASLISIFREILQLTDQPDAPLIPYPPLLSLRDILPEKVFSDPKMTMLIKGKVALFRLFMLTVKAVRPNPEGEHYLIYWKADAEKSAALVRRCKEEGTTPYAALCVAFMQAFRKIGSVRFKNKFMCPVNIRRFVMNIKDDMLFNYAPTIPLRLNDNSQEGFWGLARQLKQSISHKIDRLNAYEHLMAAEHLHASIPKLISLLRQSKGSYDCAFSNVGRIDMPDTYRSFKIDSFLGVTVALPWRNSTTLVTTHFGGQTDISFVSNDRFLPYAEALAIKDAAVDLLMKAVNI